MSASKELKSINASWGVANELAETCLESRCTKGSNFNLVIRKRKTSANPKLVSSPGNMLASAPKAHGGTMGPAVKLSHWPRVGK